MQLYETDRGGRETRGKEEAEGREGEGREGEWRDNVCARAEYTHTHTSPHPLSSPLRLRAELYVCVCKE